MSKSLRKQSPTRTSSPSRAILETARNLGMRSKENDVLLELIGDLAGKMVGIRLVVAQLLAYEADRWEIPIELFQNLLEGTDAQAGQPSNLKHGDNAFMLTMKKATRAEVDWIICAVHTMLGKWN